MSTERQKEKMQGGDRRSRHDMWVFGEGLVQGMQEGGRAGHQGRKFMCTCLLFPFHFVFGEIGKVPSVRKVGRRGFDPGIAVRKRGHGFDQKVVRGWLST